MQTKIHPAKYIMKTDDDAFVRIDEVISSLKGKPTKGLLYGLISFESSPDRDKGSKWFIDNRVFTSYFILHSAFCLFHFDIVFLMSLLLCRNGHMLCTHHGPMVQAT